MRLKINPDYLKLVQLTPTTFMTTFTGRMENFINISPTDKLSTQDSDYASALIESFMADLTFSLRFDGSIYFDILDF